MGIGMKSEASSVAGYLAALPADRRVALTKLRALIRSIAPGAIETMRWGMPSYASGGWAFSFASQKKHMAVYVCDARVVQAHRSRLGKLKCGKGCIRFGRLDELPMGIIRDMLRQALERQQADPAGARARS
jgi:uncharacterized protein YdhG (YjbR/CyaY superfamily)